MNSRSFPNVFYCWLGLVLTGRGVCAAERVRLQPGVETGAAISIDGSPQLFVDDFLIGSQQGLIRTLRQPRKDDNGEKPVLEIGDEFNGSPAMLHGNGTIVFDPVLGKYVMFARATSHSMTSVPFAERRRVYRYTSIDGMNWRKGDDGRPQRIAWDVSDSAGNSSGRYIDLFSCFYDGSDPARPYKGWIYIHKGQEGVYYVSSVDGRKWQRGNFVMAAGQPVEFGGRAFRGPEDVTLFSYDPLSRRFLGIFKFVTQAAPGKGVRSRAFALLDRLDERVDISRIASVDMVPAGAAVQGDLPSDQYYASSAWRYGSLWLGGLKVWHGEGNYPYSAAGSAFLKLIVSRDGLHWKKVPFANDAGQPEVFISNGKEGGNGGRSDGGYVCEFSQGPLRIGNELIYYYGCSSWGKNHPVGVRLTGGGIFRARLRLDGFVSVDAGTITTKPLLFTGKDLVVNTVGPVSVEVLASDGKPLGTVTVQGDSTAQPVRFGGKTLREAARGGFARLRFTVRERGQLYSFAIH